MIKVERVIFHIDVNSAFLSWEAVYRLQVLNETQDLREIPAAIGGDSSKRHGVILAKSTPAKAYHIRTGEPVVSALRKCPSLKIVPSRHAIYEEYSQKFLTLLKEYTPDVEQYSIDEAFMDMSGMQVLLGNPVEFANQLRERIASELGFTVNIGVSSNKLLAKMASDFQKPNRVHTLFPNEMEQKMWPLPVSELFFVGQATAKRLETLGVYTIGELAKMDPQILRFHLKKQGELIWKFANGQDMSLVDATPDDSKGYGNSTTIAFDVTDDKIAKMILLSLCESVSRRLRADEAKAEVVAVTIKDSNLKSVSHQMVLRAASNITMEIHKVACQLFDELWDEAPIRLLGVSLTHITKEEKGRQLSLFDSVDYEKMEHLDQAVDEIRNRFGNNAVMRASFLKPPKKNREDT